MKKQLTVVSPKVMMGKPDTWGTRIPVELILEKLAAGESEAQILEEHPRLTRKTVQAALLFAAQTIDQFPGYRLLATLFAC